MPEWAAAGCQSLGGHQGVRGRGEGSTGQRPRRLPHDMAGTSWLHHEERPASLVADRNRRVPRAATVVLACPLVAVDADGRPEAAPRVGRPAVVALAGRPARQQEEAAVQRRDHLRAEQSLI